MKKILLILQICLVFCANLEAQRKKNQQLTQADTINDISAFIYQTMSNWKVPGCAVSIVKDGKYYFSSGYGLRDTRKQLPVTTNTIFPIASCTKAFTATALAILADEGKLDWNKPVREYMPDFQLFDDATTRMITAKDLLSHRTGLPRHDLVWLYGTKSRKEMFGSLKYLSPTKPAFAQYQYNNLMYMAAGVLVERLSGKTWEEFIRTKILNPLAMKTTVLDYNELFRSADYSLSYKLVNENYEEVGFGSNVDALGPAGSIKTTASEMQNWLLMQLQNGKFNEQEIVSAKNLKETHTPIQVVYPAEAKYPELGFGTYGMGWTINTYQGKLRRQHNGSIEGYRSQTTVFPNNSLGIFITTNTDAANYYFVNIITNYITEMLLNLDQTEWNLRYIQEQNEAKVAEEKNKRENHDSRKVGAQPSHPIEQYAGVYEHPAYGTISIYQTDKGLRGTFHSRNFNLNAYHYDIFEGTEMFEDTKFTFQMTPKGVIDRFIATIPNAGDVEFKKK
jgi:CubicO group peptidase (beta-lactamase class C family)